MSADSPSAAAAAATAAAALVACDGDGDSDSDGDSGSDGDIPLDEDDDEQEHTDDDLALDDSHNPAPYKRARVSERVMTQRIGVPMISDMTAQEDTVSFPRIDTASRETLSFFYASQRAMGNGDLSGRATLFRAGTTVADAKICGSYHGTFSGFRFHGPGVLSLSLAEGGPKVEYVGDFVSGQMHGQGKLTTTFAGQGLLHRTTYSGDFEESHFHGRGTAELFARPTDIAAVVQYTGSWGNDLPQGHGDLTVTLSRDMIPLTPGSMWWPPRPPSLVVPVAGLDCVPAELRPSNVLSGMFQTCASNQIKEGRIMTIVHSGAWVRGELHDSNAVLRAATTTDDDAADDCIAFEYRGSFRNLERCGRGEQIWRMHGYECRLTGNWAGNKIHGHADYNVCVRTELAGMQQLYSSSGYWQTGKRHRVKEKHHTVIWMPGLEFEGDFLQDEVFGSGHLWLGKEQSGSTGFSSYSGKFSNGLLHDSKGKISVPEASEILDVDQFDHAPSGRCTYSGALRNGVFHGKKGIVFGISATPSVSWRLAPVKDLGEWSNGKQEGFFSYTPPISGAPSTELFFSAGVEQGLARERDRGFQRNQEHYETMSDDARRPFTCPITMDLIHDPVVLDDGRTYERQAITRHIKLTGTSPVTRGKTTVKRLRPNFSLREAIEGLGV